MITPIHLGSLLNPDGMSDAREPLFAYLVRSDDANVLVNTGLGRDDDAINDALAPDCADFETTLESTTGLHPEDIDIVVNTSLRSDHCGNNPLFSRPPVYIQAAEYDDAMGAGYTVMEWFNPMVVHYQQLNGDYQLTDHVKLIAAPGYSRGQQAVLVENEDATQLIVGRAIFDADEYEQHLVQPVPRRGAADESAYLASVRRLMDLGATTVWFCHAETPWRKST